MFSGVFTRNSALGMPEHDFPSPESLFCAVVAMLVWRKCKVQHLVTIDTNVVLKMVHTNRRDHPECMG